MRNLNQLQLMADYNKLMNKRLYKAASKMPENTLKEDKGAFFKSVFGTLNHIIVGDIIWLNRFYQASTGIDENENQHPLYYITKIQLPKSLDFVLFHDFNELKTERKKIDTIIVSWIKSLSNDQLCSVIKYKNMQRKTQHKNLLNLINHLFLHQIHHRGQITTLLSQSGIDFGETDLIEIIPDQLS